MQTKLIALIVVTLLGVSIAANSVSAARPCMKMVDRVISSYEVDGTTVNYVYRFTGVMKWIVEPTGYVEWEGGMIPVDGEFWLKQGSLTQERAVSEDSRISITSSSSSYIGTFEVVATDQSEPSPWWSLPPYMPMPKDGILNSHSLIKEYGKLGTTKWHTVTKYVDGVPETLLDKSVTPPNPPGKISTLTGNIKDYGLDKDGDSLFDYLVVSVEVRVRTAGYYNIMLWGLEDSSTGWISVGNMTYLYLERGTQFVDILLYGPIIRDSKINPSKAYYIGLTDEYWSNPSELNEIPLSREYSYTQFESWPASLTGAVTDEGINTDGNPWFDYLQIGVEVEVTEEGNYLISASGLGDMGLNFTYYLYDNKLVHLDVGTHTVYLTYNGPTIRATRIDTWYVESIYLMDENGFISLGSEYMVSLPTKYTWNQFDPPGAGFTSFALTDAGLDTDSDLKFEYLQVGVTLGVGESGIYILNAMLGDVDGNFIAFGSYTVNLVKPATPPFTQLVSIEFDGSMIFNSRLNPNKILYMELYDNNYNFIGAVSEKALTRTYDYTEFEPEFL